MGKCKKCIKYFCSEILLGKCVFRIFSPSATSLFFRSWLVTINLFLVPLVIFFTYKNGICFWQTFQLKVTFERYLQFSVLFYGVVWAIYSGFRSEFVSKYTKLLNDFDTYLMTNETLSEGTLNEKNVYSISSRALNFVEDCLSWGFNEHVSFKKTFDWYVGALLHNRFSHTEYFQLEMSNLPNLKKYLSKLKTEKIAVIEKQFADCCEFDKLQENFLIKIKRNTSEENIYGN